MTKKKHLIIGSGSAGLSAAEEIRRLTEEDEIRVVTAEDYSPYSPTVLPYFLIAAGADPICPPIKGLAESGMNQIVESAMDEGKVAGANMVGVTTEYEGWISSNIFSFFGNTAFSAGLSTVTSNNCEILVEKNEQKNWFKKLVYDGDRLVGAMFVNVAVDSGILLYLMRKKVDLADYKQALFEQPQEISRWLMLATEQKESAPIQG